MKTRLILAAVSMAMISSASFAQDNGFLTDYSVLKGEGGYGTKAIYAYPGAIERLKGYDRVMIDQPSIFIDDESKYKGMKPDTMINIAEGLRESISDGVGDQYSVVEERGEGVLWVHWAITNMYLQKPKRRLMSFTPVGLVANAAKSGFSDFVDKNTLVEISLEVEVLDSLTGDVLVSMIIQRGQRKDKAADISEDPATWEELMGIAVGLGKRLGCRLNNARLAESEHTDCLAIPISVEG